MLQEKVKRYIEENRLLRKGEKLMVAVSGGPDSLCLLHILRGLSAGLRLKLVVAHLDHGIRPEAPEEMKTIKELAAGWSLPFAGASVNVPALRARGKLSEEEASRLARYRFLTRAAAKHGAGVVAVGHHSDDQAETVLFNLLRGTGPDGLAGMLPRRMLGKTRLIRPLLCSTRAEIERYCRQYDLYPLVDCTNLDKNYTRNRIRLELIPHLEKHYNPRVKENLARLADMVAADRNHLRAETGLILTRLSRMRGNSLLLDCRALNGLPDAMRGRVVRRALEMAVPGKGIGWKHVQQLLALSSGSAPGKQVSLPGGVRAIRLYGQMVITAARAAEGKLEPWALTVPGRTVLPGGLGLIKARLCHPSTLVWPPSPDRAYLDYDAIPGQLTVRSRWPGARFHPQGAGGSKKLKDFLIGQKVPRHRRDRQPLVTAGDSIVWVAGMRIGHRYRVTRSTRQALVLEYRAGGRFFKAGRLV